MRNETKSISVRVMQFLVSSVFNTGAFNKSEFLRTFTYNLFDVGI